MSWANVQAEYLSAVSANPPGRGRYKGDYLQIGGNSTDVSQNQYLYWYQGPYKAGTFDGWVDFATLDRMNVENQRWINEATEAQKRAAQDAWETRFAELSKLQDVVADRDRAYAASYDGKTPFVWPSKQVTGKEKEAVDYFKNQALQQYGKEAYDAANKDNSEAFNAERFGGSKAGGAIVAAALIGGLLLLF